MVWIANVRSINKKAYGLAIGHSVVDGRLIDLRNSFFIQKPLSDVIE